jgi:hypothetical protein
MMPARAALAASIATTALLCFAASASAGGVDVTACGLAHHGANRWTVETVLSIREDGHPDLSCSVALEATAAIDGGTGTAVKHTDSPASGESELVYGKWTCTITNGWKLGADSTFMARRVHGQPTWVTCSDGVDVGGEDDSFAYSFGRVSLL